MKPLAWLRRKFANLSIRSKIVLIILISTLFALFVGFVAVINQTKHSYRAELRDQTQLINKVLADYVNIDLLFNSPTLSLDSMEQILSNVPDVVHACVHGDFDEIPGNQWEQKCLYDEQVDLPEDLAQERPIIRDGFVYSLEPVLSTERTDQEGGPEVIGQVFLQTSTDDVEKQIRQVSLQMFGLLVILVALAIGVAYYLQQFISQPILHLADKAVQISQNADFSVQVIKPGNDEIGLLYDGFNAMLTQIKQRQDDLERSNRDLDQFAHVASHDLKAPLRAINTLSGWLEEDLGDQLSEEGREQMQLLRSRVRRMDALIEGILRYARVGRTSAHDEEVDVQQLLHDVIELVAPPDGFEVAVGEGMPLLITTRLRLEQIFSNLINNAIKYHDRDFGLIEVGCEKVGPFYRFSVGDDGPGIAPEYHERIFRMFQTLQPRDKMESTGLGLALVKRLVEEEGGTIRLESDLGQGARFIFTWPCERTLSGGLTRPG